MSRTLTITIFLLITLTQSVVAKILETPDGNVMTIDRTTGAVTRVQLTGPTIEEIGGYNASGTVVWATTSTSSTDPNSPVYREADGHALTMEECRSFLWVQARIQRHLPLMLSPVPGNEHKTFEVQCIVYPYNGALLESYVVRWVGTVVDAASPVSCVAPATINFNHGTVRGGDIEGDTVTLSYVIRCDDKTSAQVRVEGLNANQNLALSSDIASELYWDDFKLTATGTTVKMGNGDNNMTLKSILRASGGAATPGKYTNSNAILNITFD